jgi:glutamyl-tRNA synthetase
MIDAFSLEGLLAKASVFDHKKLEWMNGQYLAHMDVAALDAYVRPFVVEAGLTTSAELTARQEWWLQLLALLRVRARTVQELVQQCGPYFRDEVAYDAAAVAKHWKDATATAEQLHACRDLAASAAWDAASLEAEFRQLAERRGVGAGKLFQPLRVALTGTAESPGIFDVLLILGRDRVLARLDAAVARLGRAA